MKNLYLLNKILETTKENRLLFMAPDKAPDAPAKAADAPAKAAEAGGEKKKETPDETKAKIEKDVAALKQQVEKAAKDTEFKTYTKGLVERAQASMKDVEAMEKLIKDNPTAEGLAKALDTKENKEALKKFNDHLKEKFDTDTLAADESVKKVQDATTAKKAEVTADKVAEELGKKVPPVTLTEAQKKEVTAKIEKAFKDIEVTIDPKAKANEKATDLKTNADAALVKINEITLESFVKAIETEIADAEKQKAVVERAYGVLVEAAKPGKLEFSLEDLQNVIGTYALGEYDKPSDKPKHAAIMKALKDNEKVLKDANINIGFLGGTDGTNYKEKLITDKDFNEKKNAALQGLLVMNANGGVSPALTPDQITLITDYNTAVTAGMPAVATFLDKAGSNHDKFFKGGGIFDLGLAYQRAQDRKIAFTGDTTATLNKADTLQLALGSGNDAVDERKSGIVLVDTTPEKPKDAGYEIGQNGTVLTVTPKKGPKDTEEPKPLNYVLTPVPGSDLQVILVPGKDPQTPPHIEMRKGSNGENIVVDIKVDPETGLPTGGGNNDYTITVTPGANGEAGKITVETNKEEKKPGLMDPVPGANDDMLEMSERAKCKESVPPIAYQTYKEAIANGDVVIDENGAPQIKQGKEYVDLDEKTSNWAVKDKPADVPADVPADAPSDPTPVDVPAEPTPTDAPPDVSKDNPVEHLERSMCAVANIPYQTKAEGKANFTVDASGKETPIAGKEWVNPDREKTTNYAVKEKEIKDYTYELSQDHKNLRLTAADGRSAAYTIENPDKAIITVESSKSNSNDKIVVVKLNGAEAYFEFNNKKDGEFMPPSGRKDKPNLLLTHEIACVGNVISIKPKETAKISTETKAKIDKIKSEYNLMGISTWADQNHEPKSLANGVQKISDALKGLSTEEKALLPQLSIKLDQGGLDLRNTFDSGKSVAHFEGYDIANDRISLDYNEAPADISTKLKAAIADFKEALKKRAEVEADRKKNEGKKVEVPNIPIS
jgi:hypothetical protein